jgi:hypothetical protein
VDEDPNATMEEWGRAHPIGFLTDQGARLLPLDPEEDATRW